MKLNNRIFNAAHEFAIDEFNNKAKRSDETHEQFRARCFFNGITRALNKEGYEIHLYDSSLGIYTFIELDKPDNKEIK